MENKKTETKGYWIKTNVYNPRTITKNNVLKSIYNCIDYKPGTEYYNSKLDAKFGKEFCVDFTITPTVYIISPKENKIINGIDSRNAYGLIRYFKTLNNKGIFNFDFIVGKYCTISGLKNMGAEFDKNCIVYGLDGLTTDQYLKLGRLISTRFKLSELYIIPENKHQLIEINYIETPEKESEINTIDNLSMVTA